MGACSFKGVPEWLGPLECAGSMLPLARTHGDTLPLLMIPDCPEGRGLSRRSLAAGCRQKITALDQPL